MCGIEKYEIHDWTRKNRGYFYPKYPGSGKGSKQRYVMEDLIVLKTIKTLKTAQSHPNLIKQIIRVLNSEDVQSHFKNHPTYNFMTDVFDPIKSSLHENTGRLTEAQFDLRLAMLSGNDPVLIIKLVQYDKSSNNPNEEIIFQITMVADAKDNQRVIRMAMRGLECKPIFVSSIDMNQINQIVKEGVRKIRKG